MPRSRPGKPQEITDSLLRKLPLPVAAEKGSKEGRGRALIIAGAVEMPGAAILASNAALRAGVGKVRLAIAQTVAPFVAAAVPELFVLSLADGAKRKDSLRAIIDSARTADAVLIGPGMRDIDAIKFLLPQLLKIDTLRALVIDASALAVAAELLPNKQLLRGKVIITPHAAEMARITGDSVVNVERDRLGSARGVAQRLGCIVALKGAATLICSPNGDAYLNKRGNAGLATAGSGDVLAGIVTGLCARGADPLQAAVWAVSLHARAGDALAKSVGPNGYLAREIPDQLPRLLATLARR